MTTKNDFCWMVGCGLVAIMLLMAAYSFRYQFHGMGAVWAGTIEVQRAERLQQIDREGEERMQEIRRKLEELERPETRRAWLRMCIESPLKSDDPQAEARP